MSLGVLNNLSAVYAENNLNNTNNSLNTVLQQLSSGSKINSGADDAAGLSLVDGLQANQTALTQSETNAQEGVGLLQVADGALSQVTSLLNRAVTLATEASNGTLNTSQDTAANQEYQSILSEINNIGSTTTYNQNQVFGSGNAVNIYTGDSSAQGSSVDDLNIAALSSANVGDTAGGDELQHRRERVRRPERRRHLTTRRPLTPSTTGSRAHHQLPRSAMARQDPSPSIAATDTVSGLIDAINESGRGLTASFTTAGSGGRRRGDRHRYRHRDLRHRGHCRSYSLQGAGR